MPSINHPLVNIGPGPNQTPADTARDAFGKINGAIQALDGAVDAAGAAAAAAQATANAAVSAAAAAQGTANTGVSNAAAAQATANTAAANASAALAQIAGRLDTITVDAAVVPTGTALPRVPDVLVVINTPPASPYWVVLPGGAARAPAGKPFWVANRAAGTLRVGEDTEAAPAIEIGSGVSALRVSMGDGTFEALAVAGETIPASQIAGLAPVAVSGAYADLSGLPSLLRTATRQANADTDLTPSGFVAVAFGTDVGTDEIGLTWNNANRTLVIPSGVSKIRLTAAFRLSSPASGFSFAFSKNAAGINDLSGFDGGKIMDSPTGSTAWPPTLQTAWIPVVAGDFFRALVRRNNMGTFSVVAGKETWITVEAY